MSFFDAYYSCRFVVHFAILSHFLTIMCPFSLFWTRTYPIRCRLSPLRDKLSDGVITAFVWTQSTQRSHRAALRHYHTETTWHSGQNTSGGRFLVYSLWISEISAKLCVPSKVSGSRLSHTDILSYTTRKLERRCNETDLMLSFNVRL